MTTVVWPHRTRAAASHFAPTIARPVEVSAMMEAPVPAREFFAQEPAVTARDTVRVVMAGGGTGGHLYPGLAVAEALEAQLGTRLELTWAATPRTVDQRLLSGFGERYVKQPVQPLTTSAKKLWGFYNGWQNSCHYWKSRFKNEKFHAVLALGGYAAGPAAYTAGKFGVPVALINPDAVPGKANRFLLKRADRVFTQWELPGSLTKNIRGRVQSIGCPIRPTLLERTREEAARRLDLDPSKKTLVITGASLGAKTINDAIMLLLKDEAFLKALAGPALQTTWNWPLNTRWQVLHLAGLEQAAEVRAAYASVTTVPVKVLDYCDDMASVWALANLAIARAGASTCAELTACGVPSVLLPYPYHKDLHQHHNAEMLAKAGAAVEVADAKNADENATRLKEVLLPLLYDANTLGDMAQKSRAAGKPRAAAAIAAELLALIGG